MYRLPVINTPVSALELDLTEGNNERRMYKLPNIQNLIITETGADKLIELENRQEAILKQLQDLKLRVSSINGQKSAEKDHHSSVDIVIHSSYRTPSKFCSNGMQLVTGTSMLKGINLQSRSFKCKKASSAISIGIPAVLKLPIKG